MSNDSTISKYDRLPGCRYVHPAVHHQECAQRKPLSYEEKGDYVFIECVDDSEVTRLALPPKVANAIASQRDALTARRRSQAGKVRAREAKERGELPGFMRRV